MTRRKPLVLRTGSCATRASPASAAWALRPIVAALRDVLRSTRVLPVLVSAASVGGLVVAAPLDVSDPFPAELVLADLSAAHGGDGTEGTVYHYGSGAFYNTPGRTVSVLGDVNSDGIDDIAIAASESVWVMYGRTGAAPADVEILDVPDDGGGFRLDSDHTPPAAPRYPTSVSSAGDVNGDGIDDIIVGSHSGDVSFVVFGRSGDFPDVIHLSSLLGAYGGDGSQGFALTHTDGSNAGHAVAGAGDVNGDGLADLVIGAPGADPGGREDAGTVFVVFGRNEPFPAEVALASLYASNGGDGSAGFVMDGINSDGAAGMSVNGAGDVNGDGIGDVVLDTTTRAFVVFGRTEFPAEVSLPALLPGGGGDGSAGTVLVKVEETPLAPEEGANAVASAGDFNGDGIGDLLVGDRTYFGYAYAYYGPAGAAFVVFGRATFPARMDLADLLESNGGDGTDGVAILGERNEGAGTRPESAELGRSVARAGDVNGDGIDDIVLGGVHDHYYCAGPSSAYVIFGSRAPFPPQIVANDLLAHNGGDGSVGVLLNGDNGSRWTGWAVSGNGDVNGDGVDDVLIGQPSKGLPPCDVYSLESYLVFGRQPDRDDDGVPANSDDCTVVSNADQRDTNGDGFGNVCDADLNGDCTVNSQDVARMRALLGTDNPHADLDGNGRVGPGDVSILVQSLGERPGPSGVPNACEPGSRLSGAGRRRDGS